MSDRPILVTGAAGFIGYHIANRLLSAGETVIGLDNLNSYYDVSLKESRLARLRDRAGFDFVRADVADDAVIGDLFRERAPRRIVHLAAQAGVRHSLDHPHDYVEANVRGFLNILEGARHHAVDHLVYASSSSVYGASEKQPFSEHDSADHPVSLYAATKRSNELMAHAYATLFNIPVTGLRFFTVYGPWGRPDMALFRFTRRVLNDEPVPVYNHGNMTRDFTYIDDVAEAVVRVLAKPASPSATWDPHRPDPATSRAPFRIFNIGNHTPVPLLEYVRAVENAVGKKARLELLPLQAGDVLSTYSDVTDLSDAVGFEPATPVEEGVRRFVEWYRAYYGA